MAKIIHMLDNDTINKIAAGEVIENPKSIVKELVENSIDAGADEIIVEIKGGGKKLIRITDNGKGIHNEEIEEAFERHCTSKISSSSDLESLYTLGFRGEALASIAAVSHVEIISRTPDEQYGVKMIIEGGNVIAKEDIGCPVGTTIAVTELFFNVPARKKFLKSDTSENSNINEIVLSLALSKKNISFKYINNDNILFKTPKTDNFINTISSLYDRELYNSLLVVDYESETIKIKGFTTNLNYYRGNRKNQLIFVNNRFIKHKRINYYIEAAYNTLLPKNKYPACFLKLELAPSLVDVNVHPAKTEVRFQNEELVLNEVKNAIYKALRNNNIIKEIKKETFLHNERPKRKTESIEIDSYSLFDDTINNYDNIKLTEINFIDSKKNDNLINNNDYNKMYDDTKYINNNQDEYEISDNIKYSDINISIDKDKNAHINIFDKIIEKASYDKNEFAVYEKEEDLTSNIESNEIYSSDEINEQESFLASHNESCENSKNIIPELSIIGIIMDTYIICENKINPEMYMIDQHAAHERINYEKFLKQYYDRKILKQELLVPEVIGLSYDDYYIAISNQKIFDDLGLSIEDFGNNAILINNVPLIFYKSNIKDLFYTILDSVKNSNKIDLNMEMSKIIKNACVESVKSGDKLHTLEVKKLIEDLRKTENPYTCPHGRPVIIKMTKYEIERMFERIQN